MVDAIDYSSFVATTTTTITTTSTTSATTIFEADDTRFVEEATFAATSFIGAYRETNEQLELIAFFINLDINYRCSLVASMQSEFDDANYSGNDSDTHSVYYFSRVKHYQDMIIRDKRKQQQNHLQMITLLYLRIDLVAYFRYSIVIFQGKLVLV